MSITTWQSSYSVGIDEIDGQHKGLIELIGHLESSMQSNDEKLRWSAIHYAIVRLSDYVRIHFAVEESLMRVLGYPEIEHHTAQHRDFENYLHDLERRSITHNVTEDEVVSFLRGWLINHIQKDDQHYAAFFQQKLKN